VSGQGQTERAVRLPLAVLSVVATVVVALLVVALVVRLDADRLPSGPPREPPPAPPQAVAFSVDGLDVRFQEFSVTMPGLPFGCSDSQTPPTGFTAYVVCGHVLHANYNAGHDWSAITGVLLVGDTLVRPGDLTATTKAVFDALVPQLYSPDDHYSLSKVSQDGIQVSVPAGQLSSRLADVNVRAKGLATPYDKLVVVVVRLQSGRHVAFFSDFPHDESNAALRAVSASASTISV
jgi:hypothetical protein